MLSRMITMAGGIAVVAWFPVLPSLPFILMCLVVSLLLALFQRHCLWLVLFLLGMLWGVVYGQQLLAARLPEPLEQQALWLEGQVVGLPKSGFSRGQPYQQFDLNITSDLCVDGGNECQQGLKRARLKWYGQQAIKPGQYWRLWVKLKRPYGTANLGGFDYQSWLIQQGIGATGYVKNTKNNQLLVEHKFTIDRLRWDIAVYLDQLPSLTQKGLLKALLIGDKRDISPQQWDLFSATGTTHLMIISGLHVGLVSGLIFFIARWLFVLLTPRCSAEFIAAWVALLAAAIYALAAGFTLPTQRALIMIAVLLFTIIRHCNIAPSTGLALALLLCLVLDPLAVTTVSFYLSFIAVAVIFYAAVGRKNKRAGRCRWLLSQYAVFIGLMPVLALCFGQVSLLSPFANSVLLPLFSVVIVPLNLLAGIIALIDGDSAFWLWRQLDSLLQLCMSGLIYLSEFGRGALIIVSAKPVTVKIIALLATLVLLLPKGLPLKAMGLFMLAPLFFYQPAALTRGDIRLTVLDVGQGLSIVVETREHVLIYDVGAKFSNQFSMAAAVVQPYLQQRGLSTIDTLVVSHNDNDHAGDWLLLVDKVPTQKVMMGDPVTHSQINIVACQAGDEWQWDGVVFEVLHPTPSVDYRSSNNRSCVLKITSHQTSFLLSGDIELSVEKALVIDNERLRSQVLIAPHHGSATSSSWPWVKSVVPDYVVFSSGYRNQFGHPHAKVVARYKQLGAQTLTTSKTGAITFSVEAGSLLPPVLYRQSRHRYWLPDIKQT